MNKNVVNMASPIERPKALNAEDAGRYLAEALGLPNPISEQGMWSYARSGSIPSVRIGRRVWFTVPSINEFLANGGTARAVAKLT
jgi:hypothetical protein